MTDHSTPTPTIPGYRIECVLARGGFSTVHGGRATLTGAAVAVKVSRDDVSGAAAQLAAEHQALTDLGPTVTPVVHDHGLLPGGERYLVMERIEWPTLARPEPAYPNDGMPLATFLPLARALAGAVARVHERGWYHGDLKPANVFARMPDQVKLIDFGSAGRFGQTTRAHPGDPVHTTLGTAVYMTPEQCRGLALLDARTDVYSLGVLYYELLLGHPPFSGHREQLLEAHRDHRPPPLSARRDLPPPIEQLIMTCLAKDPDQRFEHAGALEDALAAAEDHIRGVVPAEHPAPDAHTEPAAASAAVQVARNQRSMAHVFLDTAIDLASLRDALRSYRAHIAHIDGTRICVLFDPGADREPWSQPLRAAEELVARQLCATVVLDVGTVRLRQRQSGRVSHRSPLFDQDTCYPRATDPPGVLASRRIVEPLPARAYQASCVRDALYLISPAGERSTHTSSGSARRQPLIGRDPDIDRLLEHARACLAEGHASMATVIGDAGHGKSHACAELLHRLAQPGRRLRAPTAARAAHDDVHVIGLHVSDAWRDHTHLVPRLLLQQLFELPEHGSIEQTRHALATYLPDDSTARAVLGWVLDAVPSSDPEIERLQAVPGGLHHGLVRALGNALHACAAEHPLCVVLDNAHLADPATLDALEYATLHGFPARLWVCVFARPELYDQRPSWGDRATGAQRIELGPLGHAAAARLCRHLLMPAENIPDAAIDILVERTRGVPFFIVELIRALVRRGLVRKHEHGDMWYVATDELDALPELPSVDWLVEKELQSLSTELANQARLVALLPDDFSRVELAGILDQLDRRGLGHIFPATASTFLRRLHALGLLFTRSDGRLAFRHTLVRERIAASIEPSLAERIHEAAYLYYRRDDIPLDAAERISRQAFHAERAGAREQAACTYLTLAERAAQTHAYVHAERLYSRALALLPDVDDRQTERFFALRGRGSMRYRIGRYSDSVDDFQSALECARILDETARIHVLLDYATALDWMNEYRASQIMVERARALAQERAISRLIEARLLLGTGRSHMRFSRLTEAHDALQAAIAIADPLGDAGYETLVIALLLLCLILPVQGAVEDADRLSERLIALCERRGDRMHLASALVNRRVVCIAQKRVQQVLDDTARAIELSRELGIAEFEYVCEYNMGEVLFQTGDVAAAAPHVARALELEWRRPAGVGRPLARLLEARILAYEGRERELLPRIHALITHQVNARRERHADALFLPAEVLHLHMVALSTCDADDPQWQELLGRARCDAVEQEYLEVLEMYGLTLQRQGRVQEAARVFEEAVARARELPTIMDARLAAHLEALGNIGSKR